MRVTLAGRSVEGACWIYTASVWERRIWLAMNNANVLRSLYRFGGDEGQVSIPYYFDCLASTKAACCLYQISLSILT